jgi:hypothetical protein
VAISLKTAGTWARMVTDNGTVAIPGSPAAGDRMFLFGTWKTYTVTVVDPNGWTPIGTVFANGTTNAGNGTGSVDVMAWYRDWQSGDAAPAIDYSAAPTEGHWVIMLWQKAGGDTWGTPSTATGAIASADPFTVDASTTLIIPDASVVMGLIGLQDDETAIARATDAIDDTGALVTWNGNYVESPATHFNSTTGLDMAGDLGHRLVTTGGAGVTLHMDGDPTNAESGSAKWVVQGLFTSDPQLVTPGVASLTTAVFAPTAAVSNNQLATPSTASLSTSTFAPTISTTANQTVTPDVAILSTASFAPAVTTSEHQLVTPATATLTTALFAPTATASDNQAVTPDVASLVMTGLAPTVTATSGTVAVPDVANLSLSAFAPTVTASEHQTVTPSVASLSLSAFAPTLSVSDHQTVTPATASLSLSTFAPDVVATDPQLVIPGVASLALTTFAPSIYAGQTAVPSTASLSLITFAPSVVLTEHQLVTPEAASLTLATFAASILAPRSVTPGVAALSLTGLAPSIAIGAAGDVLVTTGPLALELTGFAPLVTTAYRGIRATIEQVGPSAEITTAVHIRADIDMT